jgi:hypothetical protein
MGKACLPAPGASYQVELPHSGVEDGDHEHE